MVQLNIRFPGESDILRRLKAISDKTGLTHRRLVEKWLEAEENGSRGTDIAVVSSDAANLTAEVAKLAERVDRLENIAGAMQSSSTSRDSGNDIADAMQSPSTSGNDDGHIADDIQVHSITVCETDDIAHAMQLHSVTVDADTRIMELKAEGFSMAGIAKTLTSEGISTPGGAKQWNRQTISNRIARLQKQNAM